MERVFIPGSEWLYFKIYTGYNSADIMLSDIVYPVITNLIDDNLIDDFFFIRYRDPQFHIRIRLHIKDPQYYGEIFNRFYKTFVPSIENGLIWNIQCDTYKRELERYGAGHIRDVERIFSIDSDTIVGLIKLFQKSSTAEEERWQLSLLLIDDMLSAFGFDLQRKFNLLKEMSESFKKEFGFNVTSSAKQLNDKYRSKRQIIESTLGHTNNSLEIYQPLLCKRKERIEFIAQTIKYDDNFINKLLGSVNHMTANRLFRSKNRVHELVIYDFIKRYYESMIAQRKYNTL